MLTSFALYTLSKYSEKFIPKRVFVILFEIAYLGLLLLFFLFKVLLSLKHNLVSCGRWLSPPSFVSSSAESSTSSGKKRVVIIGGGYAGTSIAQDLEWDFDVTLIDSKEYFEFTPSKLRTLIEPSHIHRIQMKHDQYLSKTNIVSDWVHQINIDNVLTSHDQFFYDYLVICTGARCHEAKFPSIEGVQKSGMEATVVSARTPNLEYYNHALKLANQILIIGGGTVGVELAAEIIESFPDKDLSIVHSGSSLIHRSPRKASEYTEKWFKNRSVKLILNDRIVKQDGIYFQTSQGQILEADLVFVCTGNIPNSECLKKSFLAEKECLNGDGFVLVNSHLQIPSQPNLFAGGDLTYIPQEEEKLCQTAGAAADIIIKNIRNLEKRKPLRSYEASSYPIIVSLGRYDGCLIYKSFTLTGFLPAVMKEFVEFKEMVHYWNWRRFQFWKSGKQNAKLKYSSFDV